MHASEREVAQSCLTLRDHMDCSLPGSSVHGIFQARVLEWGNTPGQRQKLMTFPSEQGPCRNASSQCWVFCHCKLLESPWTEQDTANAITGSLKWGKTQVLRGLWAQEATGGRGQLQMHTCFKKAFQPQQRTPSLAPRGQESYPFFTKTISTETLWLYTRATFCFSTHFQLQCHQNLGSYVSAF